MLSLCIILLVILGILLITYKNSYVCKQLCWLILHTQQSVILPVEMVVLALVLITVTVLRSGEELDVSDVSYYVLLC